MFVSPMIVIFVIILGIGLTPLKPNQQMKTIATMNIVQHVIILQNVVIADVKSVLKHLLARVRAGKHTGIATIADMKI